MRGCASRTLGPPRYGRLRDASSGSPPQPSFPPLASHTARAARAPPNTTLTYPFVRSAGAAPDVDVWVLALPNGLCAEHAAAIDARAAATGTRAPLMIDLSADQRFDASGTWAYGLPERPGARARIASARRIANPGCYATGAQAAIMPLLASHGAPAHMAWRKDVPPAIFGVSGYSGAGTTPSEKNDPDVLR